MSRQARNYRTGIAVLVVASVLTICVAVVAAERLMRRDSFLFETYFAESVQGLEVGAPVKLRGVRVGRVTRIALANRIYDVPLKPGLSEAAGRVVVVCEVVRDEGEVRTDQEIVEDLINAGVRLRLTSMGFTGTSFLQADYVDPERYPPMDVPWTPERPVIPSVPSAFTKISTAAERIFERLEETDVEGAVENATVLMESLNTKVAVVDLSETQRDLDDLIAEVRATNERVQRTLDGGRYDLGMILENLRVASENLRDLTGTARSYPSFVIRGAPPAPSGVAPE